MNGGEEEAKGKKTVLRGKKARQSKSQGVKSERGKNRKENPELGVKNNIRKAKRE